MKLNGFAALVAGVTLTACGGSTVSGDNAFAFATVSEATASFDALAARAQAAPQTPGSAIATSGTATFDGMITVILDNDTADGVIGTATVSAQLGSNSFSGRAGNFYNLIEEPANGELTISNGQLLRLTPALISAEIDGTITFEAGRMAIDGASVGTVTGDLAEYASGVVSGNAVPDGSAAIPITGLLVLERQ